MLGFEERVREFEYKLNDTDDQIVDFIIKNKNKAANMAIQQIAVQLFTVPNTITRLSKKLGYEGFSQMKMSLKEELRIEKQLTENSLSYNIQKTFSLIDPDKLSIVAKMIKKANRIMFLAVGDAAPLCEMMVKNLKVIGKHSEYYLHRHDLLYEVKSLEHTDILFVISLSGETLQILEMAQLAKQKKAKLISLTHFQENTLQKMADVNLYCYSPANNLNGFNTTDKTPAMLVLRAIAEYYWEVEQEK
ncbi:MurR/RpiR family transcriptional regulator [Niallia sp. FSL W8-1348]|uniref:MurR/RpiR family transcriptional regulator n=1 Tax=Niallia sp. FSL W8-1348 TaxID=2954656 RepID=UPI0030F9316D